MKTIKIRPRCVLEAFQWDGSDVEGFERNEEGLVAVNANGRTSTAVLGDWIVSRGNGCCFSWPAATFAETYEVLDG